MSEQFEIDFGDETLNDPEYEQKVQDDGTLTDTTADSESTEQSSTAPEAADAVESSQTPVQDGAGDATGQPKPAEADKAAPTLDKQGNLVDKDGNIVAKAGFERRQVEREQRQAYTKRLEADLKAAQEQNAFASALNEVPQKLGLDMRETELGLQTVASFKRDPVATARWLLQETMKMGYNLNQIVGSDAQGQVNGGSMDLNAIKAMIGEQVAPLLQDRQAAVERERTEQAAQRDYEKFLGNHEHSSVHEDVIANLLKGDSTLSPEIAYWQLREYAAKNGLDFTQPLAPQVEARSQGDTQRTQQLQQPNGNAAPPQGTPMTMPNGTGAPTNMQKQDDTFASPDDAWETIVRQSLHDAGLYS